MSIPFFFIDSFYRFALGHADAVIANSAYTAEALKKNYGADSIAIEPGIDIEKFSGLSKTASRKRLGIPQKSEVFISISKLHRRKNLKAAIDIFGARGKNPGSMMFIAGLGPDKKTLEEYAGEKGLSGKITFLGELSGNMTPIYLSASDYFVFTAKEEPFGLAPLEAEAAGCMVLPESTGRTITSWHTHSKKVAQLYKGLAGNAD